ESRDIMIDHYKCLREGLGKSEFTYEGQHYRYTNVPMPFTPLQENGPAFWYGSSNTTGAKWAGENGLHFCANGGPQFAKPNIDAYREALAKRGGVEHPKAEFAGGAAIGQMRHIYIADKDEEARRIAKPAMEHHTASLNWIRKRNAADQLANRLNVHRSEKFEDWEAQGMVIAGSPSTVARELRKQVEFLGVNYLVLYMFFGTMTLAQALRSMQLFRSEVMPQLKDL
ncbi:MAG: LLM class flavin-dependent oxidoreductase, partial [Alphaproteobacteria bacterium]|nr:LLM class flavin-dependent oxidoreductase [Alphaproteobacteria bacterium]